MSRRESLTVAERIRRAIDAMYRAYGPQGWWPVECEACSFDNSNGSREREGYHPNAFDVPRTEQGRFEVICGAVLTQNTAWQNVQKALGRLRTAGCLSSAKLLDIADAELGELIRPAGYFNQKQRYLKAVSEWYASWDRVLLAQAQTPELLDTVRPALLKVRGIGPETADSILLYAYALPTFVVDAYTRRVFGRLGIVHETDSYEKVQRMLADALRDDSKGETVRAYQEAHALIVEHAKRHHGRRAEPALDFLVHINLDKS